MSYFFSVFINLGLSFSLFDLMNIRYIQRLSYSWQNIIFKHRHIISKRIIIFATRNPYLQAISCIIITGINRTFMELKPFSIKSIHNLIRCINRTFMELKRRWRCHDNGRTTSINRTFMELKRSSARAGRAKSSVLIEPLWNWNNMTRRKRTKRTFVLIEPLWNWNGIISQMGNGIRPY